jgi:hypothetical protein
MVVQRVAPALTATDYQRLWRLLQTVADPADDRKALDLLYGEEGSSPGTVLGEAEVMFRTDGHSEIIVGPRNYQQ